MGASDDEPRLSRADRIERSRRTLAERQASDPAGVERFNLRMSRLTQARKREQQRLDHLVFGKPRPKPTDVGAKLTRPADMPKTAWKVERQRLIAAGAELDPEIERAMQLREQAIGAGTPETLAAAARHDDSFAQLVRNGTIDNEQREYGAEIANVHRSIEADVSINVASMEARVDNSAAGRNLTAEGIKRVRMHHAYTIWRAQLPMPKGLVLDMIVGDAVGYSVAAKRYRVHNRRAKRELLAALDRWPGCVDQAHADVTRDRYNELNAAAE